MRYYLRNTIQGQKIRGTKGTFQTYRRRNCREQSGSVRLCDVAQTNKERCVLSLEMRAEMENHHERILSILSRAISTPLISSVTRRGKIVSLVLSVTPSASSDLLSNKAFSSAKGKLSVILVSWIVNLDRPMTSKYDNWRKACCNSSRRVISACRAYTHARQATFNP